MNDIETRVRDAVATHVDRVDASPRLVERALATAGVLRQRRRRRRALAGAIVATAGVVALVGMVVAGRHHQYGGSVTALAPTSVASVPKPTLTTGVPSPKTPIWTNDCGVVPTVAGIPGLAFTLQVPSTVVRPGGSARATVVLSNATDHDIDLMTGIGAWYVTTPSGRIVATTAGEPVISIGYGIVVPAHGVVRPAQLQTGFAAAAPTCTENGPPPVPLPKGNYLAWDTLPDATAGRGAVLLSQPVPFEVAGPTVWNVAVTRDLAIRRGKRDAIDRRTAIVKAKLASWGEIQAAGADVGSSPTDDANRTVWVVSISGAPRPGLCCLAAHKPFRWGVEFVDAETGDAFSFAAGANGDVAPWFARLPDHGA